ncbi:MAG: protein-L-isoaspartate O-methyltransferase [Mariprofundaceae bacterium]|nr:protein-L-isoaspartate O-methyltransferase [Mariprofundaceae bacterium]
MMDLIDFETARHNMVENQIRCCKILDPVLLDTLETMPREAFLPDDIKSLAYMEGRIPLPCGQEMLSPLQEGYIMQTLDLRGDERVLEIGAGTGFLTALLAMHAKEVIAFELHAPLAELAKKNLDAHGITNVTVTCANGMEENTLQDAGKFDAIVLDAALETVPEHLANSLREGGHLVAFTGVNPVVKLVSMKRTPSGGWQSDALIETLLQNMEGLPEKREFVF